MVKFSGVYLMCIPEFGCKSTDRCISYISLATVNGGLLLKVGDNNNTLAVCNVLVCKVSMCIYK